MYNVTHNYLLTSGEKKNVINIISAKITSQTHVRPFVAGVLAVPSNLARKAACQSIKHALTIPPPFERLDVSHLIFQRREIEKKSHLYR